MRIDATFREWPQQIDWERYFEIYRMLVEVQRERLDALADIIDGRQLFCGQVLRVDVL